MSHVGLELSRARLDASVPDSTGETAAVTAAEPNVDPLREDMPAAPMKALSSRPATRARPAWRRER